MAVIAVRNHGDLGPNLALAPERFDPRRVVSWECEGSCLETVVALVRQAVQPAQNGRAADRILVVDTTHAQRGILEPRHTAITVAELGSSKKLAKPGDVLVSRLRPYLQQVAFVDAAIPGLCGAELACSTEFYVLRSRENRSIGFLVPFLLSPAVQSILSAAQEGGHHPRFAASVLLALPVPDALLAVRDEVSREVEAAIVRRRQAGTTLDRLTASVNGMLVGPGASSATEAAGVVAVRPR